MDYTKQDITNIVNNQRNFFKTNQTLDVKWRIEQLKKLKNAIQNNEDKLSKALYLDLGRCETEAYLLDIGIVISEINEIIHNLHRWAKPETHFSGIMAFPSTFTKVYKMPYGVTLIVSPFNFPILLSIGVLAASISAGNTAMIKVSSKTPNVSNALYEIINNTFPENYVTIITGGHDVADYCLEERVDKIFYTGSPNVAKHVMEMASKNLTPVALELGGETGNWAIVRSDADIKDAARKIAFFKICNSGQICININQVAVSEDIADQFINELKKAIIKQIGDKPYLNEEYPHLASKRAFEYCEKTVELYKDKIVFGGEGDINTLKYSTTVLYPIDINEKVVNEELFCPILPVVVYKEKDIDKLLSVIADREHGLALYLFTKDIKWAKKVMQTHQYGGGCVNEVCMHLVVKGVPFNGTGHSGMGAYHGEWGFREFSHPSTVLYGKTKFNLSLREHPYKNTKKKSIFKKLMK